MVKWNRKAEVEQLKDLLRESSSPSGHGKFVDLSNDLGSFFDYYKNKDPLVMMAYAYARRLAVAGIYFQTIVGSDYFEYVNDIFKGWQGRTDGSYDFQEAAMAQAVEVALNYSPELNEKKLKSLVVFAEKEVDFTGLSEMVGIELAVSDDPNSYYSLPTVSKLLDEYFQHESRGAADNSGDLYFLAKAVPMAEPTEWGGFIDMYNDIAAVTPSLNEMTDSLFLLSTAEALTVSAMGNYIQGFMTLEVVDNAFGILAQARGWAGDEQVKILDSQAKVQAAVLVTRYIEEFRPHYSLILLEAVRSGLTLPKLELPTGWNGFYSTLDVLRLLDPERFS